MNNTNFHYNSNKAMTANLPLLMKAYPEYLSLYPICSYNEPFL